jgi:5-methylcytosine-specific restriction enzyme subunit McrC
MRYLPTLREHVTTEVDLAPDDAAAIARHEQLKISVTPCGGGRYQLRPASIVGACTLSDLRVVVRPRKLTMARVFWMLAYAEGQLKHLPDDAEFARAREIEEVAALAFARMVDTALARGVLQGYRTADEALPTVRGRLRIEDQLRKRLLLFPPAEVRYDDYTEDIEENRRLRASLRLLLAQPLRSATLRSTLRRQHAALGGTTPVDYQPGRVPAIPITRLNRRYASALHLARVILNWSTYELDGDGVHSSGFLVDMNKVFEAFVHTALEDTLGRRLAYQHSGELARSTRRDTGVAPGGLRRTYDTVIPGRDHAVGVIVDAKYKQLDNGDAHRDDVHQMLAYCIAEGRPDGVLIYVGTGVRNVEYEIKHVGVRIHALTVDLSRDPATTLDGIKRISTTISQFPSLRQAVPA